MLDLLLCVPLYKTEEAYKTMFIKGGGQNELVDERLFRWEFE